jgi:hypothetical protein
LFTRTVVALEMGASGSAAMRIPLRSVSSRKARCLM